VDIHPLAKYEIAQLRNEDRLARSLAAYAAVQAREGNAAELDARQKSARRFRFVGSLPWRGAGARRPNRPAI
jgi:hypothetical protein